MTQRDDIYGSRPYNSSSALPVKTGLRAPLSRADLDRAGPWFRAVLGLVFIAISVVTTVRGVQQDFAPLLAWHPFAGPIAGIVVAALLSVGQWLTSERVPFVYLVLVLIDARYTQAPLSEPIFQLATYHLHDMPVWAIPIVAMMVSWTMALLVARFGEILLFGRRR